MKTPPISPPAPLRLAITLGDPAGVGPEIILRLFSREADLRALRQKLGRPIVPFVVGEARHLEQAAQTLIAARQKEEAEPQNRLELEKRGEDRNRSERETQAKRGKKVKSRRPAGMEETPQFHFQDDEPGAEKDSRKGRELDSTASRETAPSEEDLQPDALPIANLRIHVLSVPPSGYFGAGIIPVIQPSDFRFRGELETGKVSAECGAAAWAYIRHAVALVQSGAADGIVTAPLHKEALQAAGCPHPGHTEMLAELAGGAQVAMLLVGGGLRVALATIHEAIARVPSLLTRDGILEYLRLMDRFIPWFGIQEESREPETGRGKSKQSGIGKEELESGPPISRNPGFKAANRPAPPAPPRRPRIGVTGLNPHAGEGGMFGFEEREIIAPAIEAARAEGIDAVGPLPADTAFHFHREGACDAILAMYHDQALIPVKTLAFHDGVNVTMGLPFIRTSVDHGTAFDIVGKGLARPDSLRAALECAAVLVKNRD